MARRECQPRLLDGKLVGEATITAAITTAVAQARGTCPGLKRCTSPQNYPARTRCGSIKVSFLDQAVELMFGRYTD